VPLRHRWHKIARIATEAAAEKNGEASATPAVTRKRQINRGALPPHLPREEIVIDNGPVSALRQMTRTVPIVSSKQRFLWFYRSATYSNDPTRAREALSAPCSLIWSDTVAP
jgi:hypothetical protein